jgi:TonB family protein
VELDIELMADGSVRMLRLHRSSGHELLDEAAFKLVTDIGRFPLIPTACRRERVRLVIPLRYELTGR